MKGILTALISVLFLALALPITAEEEAPEIFFQWVDEDGIVHFVDQEKKIPQAAQNLYIKRDWEEVRANTNQQVTKVKKPLVRPGTKPPEPHFWSMPEDEYNPNHGDSLELHVVPVANREWYQFSAPNQPTIWKKAIVVRDLHTNEILSINGASSLIRGVQEGVRGRHRHHRGHGVHHRPVPRQVHRGLHPAGRPTHRGHRP